ncbi:MAG: L-histidine N(alpha)-methyltransferase [Rhodothermales bacterium]|nr:L-histidine N(alpha)-methyltransferase [Rhodothermales bacterium]
MALSVEQEIVDGLRDVPKRIASKFLYDERGSALFDLICDLPEYYPTRTESSIMAESSAEMVDCIGQGSVLIELGSGSSTKTRALLDRATALAAYVPVDISAEHLSMSAQQLRREYPKLNVEPVAADYTRPIRLPDTVPSDARRVVYFPGSTFGNFLPDEGVTFLRQIRDLIGPEGGLLIGLDWRKDTARLEAAYNDSQGVTAEFNLNILTNLNRLAGADFVEQNFEHYAFFNELESRIEIYVVSKCDHAVHIADEEFVIEADEAILTEVSYKYRPEDFLALAAQAGFSVRRSWSDRERLFGILFLTAT